MVGTMTIILDDVLNRIMDSGSIAQLAPAIDDLSTQCGFAASTYADLSQIPLPDEPVPYYTSTLDRGFLDVYLDNDLAGFDPIVRRAAASNAPFLWTDCADYRQHLKPRPGVKGRVHLLVGLTRDYGYEDGYVIPCHARDQSGRPRSGVISLFWPGDPRPLSRPDALPAWFRLAALVYHERSLALRAEGESDVLPQPKLTDREREVLVWACRGKTTSETSDILNLSERTVEFHIANAMRKLNVHNKVHCVAVAVQMGLVSP